MRILHLTDLHHNLRWFDWVTAHASDADLVCISGDLLDLLPSGNTSLSAQVRNVTDWVNSFAGVLALCSGNHDWLQAGDALPNNQAEGKWLRNLRRAGRVMVDGDDAMIADHRVVCRPWIGSIPPINDAFPTILVSHAGPAKSRVACGIDCDLGDDELRPIALSLVPGSVLLCGHVHQPLRWLDPYGECTCINPGSGPMKAAEPSRIVIDLDQRVADIALWMRRRMRATW